MHDRACPMKTYTTAALTGSKRFHLLTYWRRWKRWLAEQNAVLLYTLREMPVSKVKPWGFWLKLLVLLPHQGPIHVVICIPCVDILEQNKNAIILQDLLWTLLSYNTSKNAISYNTSYEQNTLDITPLKTLFNSSDVDTL